VRGLATAPPTASLGLPRTTIKHRRGEARQQGIAHSPLDSAGGAAIGAVWALGLVILVAWIAMGVHGAFKIGPDISHSLTGQLTSSVTKRVTYAVTRQRTGNVLVASALALVAGQPGTGVETMNTLLSNQGVRRLWNDSTLRRALAQGDVNSVARHPTLRALAADTQFVHAAAQIGLGTAGLNEIPGADQFAADLVTQAGPLVRAFQSLGSEPEMRRLINSPGVQNALENRNLSALMESPEIRQLASRFADILKNGATGPLSRTASQPR